MIYKILVWALLDFIIYHRKRTKSCFSFWRFFVVQDEGKERGKGRGVCVDVLWWCEIVCVEFQCW